MRKAREQHGKKGRDGWSAVGIEEFESFEDSNDGCHNDTTTGAPRSIQVNAPAPHLAMLTE